LRDRLGWGLTLFFICSFKVSAPGALLGVGMAWSEADVVGILAKAGAKGLTKGELAKSFSESPKSKKLTSVLTALKSRGAIRGPFHIGKLQRYFDVKHAPTREQLESRIEKLLPRLGMRVTAGSVIDEVRKGDPKSLFEDALRTLKANGRIIELRYANNIRLYAHRDAILDQLRLENKLEDSGAPRSSEETPSSLMLDDVRPAYLALKSEQGGISAVKIYDVWKKLNVSKDALHALLLREAQNGRVSLHAASTVHFPAEVVDAGIRVEGEPQPFVTFVLREAS
jgi:hypothetical protein